MRKNITLVPKILFIFWIQSLFQSLHGQSSPQEISAIHNILTPINERLISLEKQRFLAMTQKDTVFLKGVLADDLIYIHSNALVETKKDFLHSISTGKITYKTLTSEEIYVRIFPKTAIINGIVHVIGTLNGKEFDLHLRYTDIYCKNKNKWQLEAWQSVKIP